MAEKKKKKAPAKKKAAPKKTPAKKAKKKATKSKTDKFGRPTVMTKEILSKLEMAFAIGSSDVEACLFANIAPATLYNYQKKNEDFLERKEELKQTPLLKARKLIIDSIAHDLPTAKWYLERKLKNEFSTKVETEHSGPNGAPLPPVKVTFHVVDPREKS